MLKLAKLSIIIIGFAFLIACAAKRNEYGVPIDQWQKLPKKEQQLIKHSYEPIQFDDE